ncbi:MAG: hypothetical protein ACYCT1_09185 [Steroidobacteraceae bacterium]
MINRTLGHVGSIACAAALLAAGAAACRAASPIQELLACRRIEQAAARLACFDRASARLAAAPPAAVVAAASAAPMVASRPAPVTNLSAEQAFGLSYSQLTAHEVAVGALPKPASHIGATLRRVTTAADGRWIFSLSNGQVWVQQDPDHDLLANPGQHVTIFHQMFGSYWLRLADGSGCTVKRIR